MCTHFRSIGIITGGRKNLFIDYKADIIEARTIQYADPLGSIEILAGEREFKKVIDLSSTSWNDDVMSSQNIWREFKKFIEHSIIINPCQTKVNNFNILL